jgi:uncharacterized membrane protein YeaQ/YmgE (transglycosylase-associated protein family)
MDIIYVLLIGAAAGWIAGWLTKGKGFGVVGNVIIGVLGALVGGFVLPLLGLRASGLVGLLVQSVIGALVLLFLLGIAQQRRRGRRA